jgi:large-conductance mechanosensitive channel
LIGTVTVKADFVDFLVDNIIEPLVTGIIDNAANMLTNAILGIFGKRDAWGFIVDNIIDPLVDNIIDNTVNLITNSILGLFGKRDAWGFIVDNIIDPLVDNIIDNIVNLITGAILGIFGKRGLDITQLLKPLLQQFLPALIQSTINAIGNLITTILPLAKQEALHLPGPATHVGIVKALTQLDEQMKLNVQVFLSSIIQAVQTVVSNVQLNQLVALLNQVVSVFLNLSHFIEPIINQLFALLSNPFVGQLIGQIIG